MTTAKTKKAPATGGRPRKYRSSVIVSLRGEAAELEEIRSFARWRAFRENRPVSLAQAILDAVHESKSFRLYLKERAKV